MELKTYVKSFGDYVNKSNFIYVSAVNIKQQRTYLNDGYQ